MAIAFWIFAALTIISALGVVFAKRPLHSALWLVATLFLVAVHFALMGADFIAALQVVIYAGAIMILVVMVIMLLGLEEAPLRKDSRWGRYGAAILCGAFAGLMLFAFNQEVIFPLAVGTIQEASSSQPREVGLVLMQDFVYAFQIIALLLLTAIIGAVLLAYEKKRPLAPGRGLKAVREMNQNSSAVES